MAERRTGVTRLDRPNRSVRLGIAAVAGALLALPFRADAAQIASARLSSTSEFTRVIIEADAPAPYKMFSLSDPPRLVLDLEETQGWATLDRLSTQVSPQDDRLRAVRVGRFKPGVVRLVFELKTEVQPQSHPWKPVAGNAYRLTLDIQRQSPVDPVMALLAKRPEAPDATAPAAAKTTPPLSTVQQSAAKPATESPAPAPFVQTPNAEPSPTAAAPVPPIGKKSTVEAGPSDRTATVPVKLPLPPSLDLGRRRDNEMERLVTVAIDPGHGGEDPGAKGQNGTQEKAVTLAIARRLKAILDEQPNMRGVLTRDGDVFIPLHHRVVKARNVQADLFVSIHADAYIRPHARGSSVFALSDRGATSAAARWLAKRENDADLIGGVNLDVPDPNLKRVLLDLSQTATINDSLRLGRAVLSELSAVNTLHKTRVEQAGFAVLKAPDIPSILVETAFISNPAEEQRLSDETYQTRLAGAIANGIRRYFAKNPPLARSRLARSDLPATAPVPPAIETVAADDAVAGGSGLRFAAFETTVPDLRVATALANRQRLAARASDETARQDARSPLKGTARPDRGRTQRAPRAASHRAAASPRPVAPRAKAKAAHRLR